MKFLISSLLLFCMGCSVECDDSDADTSSQSSSTQCPSDDASQTAIASTTVTPAPTSVTTAPSSHVSSLQKEQTSTPINCYVTTDKGCIHFNLAQSNLSLGDFLYRFGLSDFAHEFPEDVAEYTSWSLGFRPEVKFRSPMTVAGFNSRSFAIAVGSSRNYDFYNLGGGNFRIDYAYSDVYTIVFVVDIDLLITLGKDRKDVPYCALIRKKLEVSVIKGQQAEAGGPINELDLKISEGDCSTGRYRIL